MPVSRKRKKKPSKSGKSRGPARVAQHGPDDEDRRGLAEALQGLAAYRDQATARRTALATAAATGLVTDLVAAMANQPDMIVADELALRLGAVLTDMEEAPLERRIGPSDLATALVTAAEARAGTTGGQAVLAAAAEILPFPDRTAAVKAVTRLGGTVREPVTGPVWWTRDRYGSRFGVTTEITTGAAPLRWYLWDIDACGHQAFIVHSGFYATRDAALAAWQDGVGEIAAAGTAFAEVDDRWLLVELLPADGDLLRSGEDNVAPNADHYRSRWLAQVVKQAMPPQGTRPGGSLDAPTAAAEFTAWLRDQRELPKDIDELATELADSWCLNDIDATFTACSPHRVALCVLHLRNYYLDEFADELMALLPDWTRWLAARDGTPPELADRCLPYAKGQPHPQVGSDDSRPSYLARVIE